MNSTLLTLAELICKILEFRSENCEENSMSEKLCLIRISVNDVINIVFVVS